MNVQHHSELSSTEEKSKTSYKRNIIMALLAIVSLVATYMLLYYLSWLDPQALTEISNNGVTTTTYYSSFNGSASTLFFLMCVILPITFVTCKAKVVYWGIQGYVWLLGLALAYISSGFTGINFYFLTLPQINNASYGFFIAIALSFVLLIFKTYVIRLLVYLLESPSKKVVGEPHDDFGD